MKPSLSTHTVDETGVVEEEGSTVDIQQQQNCGNDMNTNAVSPPNNRPSTSSTFHNNLQMMASKQKQQAWFQSSVMSRTEAYIEAQVMQLTEECRLFQEDDDDDSQGDSNLALLQRHEIQTSWSLVGNGAFSEVYTVQNIRLLDGNFVDPAQQEARGKLQHNVNGGRALVTIPGSGSNPTTSCTSCAATAAAGLIQTATNPQNTSEQQYVIKHLRRDLLANRKKFIHAAGDLVLEAMYLTKLVHPNIIALRGCAVGGPNAYSDGRHDSFFLILDKLDCTLSNQIQDWEKISAKCPTKTNKVYSNNLVDFEEKLQIGYQIGCALEYLHGKDIIFRDLKPDNVGLIRRPNQSPIVKLFDFGLCRELPEANPHETKVFHMSGVGTRRYMSPEVFLGQYYNVKADVYSWTMVLHAMLSLQRPFEMYNADLHKLLVCQEGVRPTIYKDWPQPIHTLLRKGWAASSMDRPRMVEICSTIEGMLNEISKTKQSMAESSSNKQRKETPSEETKDDSSESSSVEQSIASFVESWTQHLCVGQQTDGTVKRSKKSLLRTLEAHLVADTAGTQLLMIREKHHPHFRDRVGADYPQMRHLRSSYL